jgi:hypothetical protein
MPRRLLTENVNWDDSYFQLAYTVDALDLAVEEGDKDLSALAKAARPLLDRYDALDVERRKRERAVNKSHVRVKRRDLESDALVTEIHKTALIEAKLDREEPSFKRLFPSAVSRVVKMALESELTVLRALREAMDHSATPKGVKALGAKLTASIKAGDQSLETRRKAFSERADASLSIQSWREDVNSTLLGIEGELTALAARRKLSESWVDSFFPPAAAVKKRKAVDPAPAPAE